MKELLALYQERLQNFKYETTVDLLNLLLQDERMFYFALMYFFLTKRDLGTMIQDNAVLTHSAYVFCEMCDSQEVTDYFHQYVNLKETKSQIDRLNREIAMFIKRKGLESGD